MIGVRIVHVAHLIQDSKKIIVSVAILQVNAHVLHIATRQINCASFCGDGSRVQRDVVGHLNWLLLKLTRLEPVELHTLLVPLEGVQSLRVLWAKTALDIVVYT